MKTEAEQATRLRTSAASDDTGFITVSLGSKFISLRADEIAARFSFSKVDINVLKSILVFLPL